MLYKDTYFYEYHITVQTIQLLPAAFRYKKYRAKERLPINLLLADSIKYYCKMAFILS